MIRINLLPVRAAKKKESIRFQLTIAGLVTFLVVAVSVSAYLVVRGEAARLSGQIASGQQEMTELKKKIGELSRIKEQKKIVEEKLGIITQLESDRTGPVKLLRNISDAIPQKAWMKSLKDENAQITVEGYAVDDEVVADFMRGLERANMGAVELEVAQRVVEKETDSEVVNFVIRIEKPKPVRPDDEVPAGGKKPARGKK